MKNRLIKNLETIDSYWQCSQPYFLTLHSMRLQNQIQFEIKWRLSLNVLKLDYFKVTILNYIKSSYSFRIDGSSHHAWTDTFLVVLLSLHVIHATTFDASKTSTTLYITSWLNPSHYLDPQISKSYVGNQAPRGISMQSVQCRQETSDLES